jgi:hypothetical protein
VHNLSEGETSLLHGCLTEVLPMACSDSRFKGSQTPFEPQQSPQGLEGMSVVMNCSGIFKLSTDQCRVMEPFFN